KERAYILNWAEKGKPAVLFALKSHSMAHTYIDHCWYGSMSAAREKDAWSLWQTMCPEPDLLRCFCCGKPTELASALDTVLAGKEAVVPVLTEGSKEDLRPGHNSGAPRRFEDPGCRPQTGPCALGRAINEGRARQEVAFAPSCGRRF